MSSYIATCLERSADLAEWLYEQNVGVGEWMGDTPQTVMTTRAPAVLKSFMKYYYRRALCNQYL